MTLFVIGFTAKELAALKRNYFLLGVLAGLVVGVVGLGYVLESLGRIHP